MVALLAAAMLVFVLTCSGVGLRLLWLAHRGAGRPAWLCGAGFALIGFVGFPLGVASGQGSAAAGDVRLGLCALGLLGNAAGLGCFFVFTLSVFRPAIFWARGLAAGAIAGMLLATAGIVEAIAAAPPAQPSSEVAFAWSMAFQLIGVLCFAWMGAEGLREWAASRRRVALGLADPVSSQRLLLWALFGVGAMLNSLVLVAVMACGLSWSASLLAQLSQTACGLWASAFALLAFSPASSLRSLFARVGA